MQIDRELLKGSISLLLLNLLSRGEMYGYEIVPPVNSDQFDKLGFVAHQSFAFRTCSNGLFRLPQRLVSEPCGPPVGDPGLTSSARSAAALCQAPEVEPC